MKKEALNLTNEKFIPIGAKSVDSKNRINLGGRIVKSIAKKMGAESYQIFIGEEGDILLRPMVSVPSQEAWIYHDHKALGQIRKGLAEAKEGKIEKAGDLGSFLKKL